LTADLGRWVAATRTIIAAESESNQAKLLNGNAGRIYRLN
jgi:predicted TIM-barrel fold metal-dependent hydrolase